MRRAVSGGIALLISAALYAPMGVQAATDSTGLEEVVVTATRRAESVQDVPVSVTVFSQEQMDIQGVKQVDDIARLSPSVQFGRGGGFGSDLGNFISIRGMGSFAGPATTGIYVDDTPTQVGATIASGSFTDNAYPMLFDIERVEVLNGPQGTLFGSGSEGGAVRFIQPAPNMSKSALYARTEVSGTTYGAPSYEAGIAGGAPLVPDVLGFRASVWTRHTGGYVDHVDYYTGNTVNPDNNYQDAVSLRLALGWQPVEGLMITPSFYYQRIKANGDNMFYFP
ncbi:MAG: TonB-dependent receptor plug domain-containing protein, partial [Gammaproteobacteria bacterium]|nr:TonB-dependent receptor plug domain-containing protein [Gammaproteobacteria bacterium]